MHNDYILFNIHPPKKAANFFMSIRNVSRITTVPRRDHKLVLGFGSYMPNYSLRSNNVLSVEFNLDLNPHILMTFSILYKYNCKYQTDPHIFRWSR